MQIVVQADGSVRCLYDKALDLHCLGPLVIGRGSHVEPTAAGQWTADLSPVAGAVLLGMSKTRGVSRENIGELTFAQAARGVP